MFYNKLLLSFVVAVFHTAVCQNIITPCDLTDTGCIQYVLAENSDCNKRVWGSVPNELIFNNVEFQAPNFNATLVDQYTIVKNLDKCYISAFFLNPDRNRAVLAITCPDLYVEAYRALVQHYPLLEDEYYFYTVQATHPPIIFTADFRHADDIDMCSAYVFPYITGLPKYKLVGQGPRAEEFKEGDENNILRQLNVYVREEYSQRAVSLYQLWVNNVLCNFDVFCTE